MRFRSVSMIAALLCCMTASAGAPLFAQSMPAGGAAPKYTSPKAKAEVKLKGATITIDYCTPSAHGRKIFGGLVPYGEVWRTGANAATTLTTTGDLMIGDLKVPAGTYTIYSLPTDAGMTLIVNKQTGQWGTIYKPEMDLGRAPMIKGSTEAPVETFAISFEKTMADSTELHLKWADVDASVAVKAGM